MNSLYDVYVKLFGASIIDESGYNKEENTIEYTNDNFKLIAYKSANGIMVDFLYDGQLFSFIPPNYDNLCALITELHSGEVTIERISRVTIRLDGYDMNDGQKFNKHICAICIIIAAALAFIGTICSVNIISKNLIVGSDITRYFTSLNYIPLVIMAIHIIQYGLQQQKYKKNLFKLIVGNGLFFFFIARFVTTILETIADPHNYPDYIGYEILLYVVLACYGIYLLNTSNVKTVDRISFLTRIPNMSAYDADAIITYMNKVCKDVFPDYNNVVNNGADTKNDIDVFMRACANNIGISVSYYLSFQDVYDAASQVTKDLFWTSDLVKYFYERVDVVYKY